VGPRAGLDGCGKSRPNWDSIPDRPARSHSLYRLTYRAHKLAKGVFENYFPPIALQLYTVILETRVALIPAYFIFFFKFNSSCEWESFWNCQRYLRCSHC